MSGHKITISLAVAKCFSMQVLSDVPKPVINLTHGTYKACFYHNQGVIIKNPVLEKVCDDITYPVGRVKSEGKTTVYNDYSAQRIGIYRQETVYRLFRDDTWEAIQATFGKEGVNSVGPVRSGRAAEMPKFKGSRTITFTDDSSYGSRIDETGDPSYTATINTKKLISGAWDVSWNITPLDSDKPKYFTSKVLFLVTYALPPGIQPPETYERVFKQPVDGTVNSITVNGFIEK
jgi:hypothetical protein